jgi:hypothetical protein
MAANLSRSAAPAQPPLALILRPRMPGILVSGLPLMHRISYIRLVRVEEAAALSDLCFRSKAVWGYDPWFLMLMPAALEVVPEHIAAGDVWIATGVGRGDRRRRRARARR